MIQLRSKLVLGWIAGLAMMAALVGKGLAAEPSTEVFDARALDGGTLKSSTLESLIQRKVSKIIDGAMINPKDYRVSVTVSVKKRGPVQETDTTDIENSQSPTSGSLLSVDDLIRSAEKERTEDETAQSVERGEPSAYDVDRVQIQVSFSERVTEEAKTATEAALKAQLGSLYSEKLQLEVKTAPAGSPDDGVVKATPPSALDNLAKVQFLVVSIVFGLVFLGGLLMFKLIPGKQGENPFRIQLSSDNAQQLAAAGVPLGGQPGFYEQPLERMPVEREAASGGESEWGQWLAQMQGMEKKIADFIKKNPKLLDLAIQEWAGAEQFAKLSLYLESLAKEGIPIPSMEFRSEISDAIRSGRKEVSRLQPKARISVLEEVYWDLVSNVFLGEEITSEHFKFLDEMDDASLLELIRAESTQNQVAVLLALPEKRSARILSSLEPEHRQSLVQAMFVAEPVEQGALGQLALKLRNQSKKIVSSKPKTVRLSDGVGSLVPILETMDFETQFYTTESLLTLPPDLKSELQSNFFNAALLREASDDFLQSVFQERDAEWSHSVLAIFGDEFRERVLNLLPPLQQRMLRDMSQNPVSPSYAWGILQEFNEDILAQINRGDLRVSQIYPEEPLLGTGGPAPEGEEVSGDGASAPEALPMEATESFESPLAESSDGEGGPGRDAA